MALPVLVMAPSGGGKTTSLRNFEPDEIGIFNTANKPLPFRKKLPVVKTASYQTIYNILERGKAQGTLRKVYAIDDADYLMTFEAFGRAKEIGYGKFTDFAVNFYNLVQYIINSLPDDVIVYFLMHTERTEAGEVKAKTTGKMIDNQLTLEGLFSIVLYCQTDGHDHWFTTQSDGFTTAKSPMGMFPERIDNDLKHVDTVIREYYEFDTAKVGETENA
jgi:hypothetical protein